MYSEPFSQDIFMWPWFIKKIILSIVISPHIKNLRDNVQMANIKKHWNVLLPPFSLTIS